MVRAKKLISCCTITITITIMLCFCHDDTSYPPRNLFANCSLQNILIYAILEVSLTYYNFQPAKALVVVG